jgi:hypothetical protein
VEASGIENDSDAPPKIIEVASGTRSGFNRRWMCGQLDGWFGLVDSWPWQMLMSRKTFKLLSAPSHSSRSCSSTWWVLHSRLPGSQTRRPARISMARMTLGDSLWVLAPRRI